MRYLACLALLIASGCACDYSYLQASAGPAGASEAAARAWAFYGRADSMDVTIHWIAKGDCLGGLGFVHHESGACVAGVYSPVLTAAWIMDVPRRLTAHGSTMQFGREDHLCHELLHAAIDAANGPTLDGDEHHTDKRWSPMSDGTIGVEQMCTVVLAQTGFGDEPPGASL